jgi:gliding motility-associated lipoprotein GldH
MNRLLLISLVLIFSCKGSTFYRENIEIDVNGWKKSEPAVFHLHIADNRQAYNTFVIVRHNALYKYSNLWMFIHISDPAGNKVTDTVECFLSDHRGKWYGSGLGDMKTVKMVYRPQVTFPDTGVYEIMIEQAMRENPLLYITDVGISVETIQ